MDWRNLWYSDLHNLTLYFLNAFCITWAEWNNCCCSDSAQEIPNHTKFQLATLKNHYYSMLVVGEVGGQNKIPLCRCSCIHAYQQVKTGKNIRILFCQCWCNKNEYTTYMSTYILYPTKNLDNLTGNLSCSPERTRCEKSWCLTFADSLINSQSSTTDGDSLSKNSWVDTVDLLDTDAILGDEGTGELVLYCSKSILNWLGSNWVMGECTCTPSGISGRVTPGLILRWLQGELMSPPLALPLWIGLPIWLVSNREGEEDPWSLAASRLARFGSDKWWWEDDSSDAPYIVGGTRKLSNDRGSLLILVFDIFLWTWACADNPSGYEPIEGSGCAQKTSNGPGKCSVLSYKALWSGSDWWAKLKSWSETLPELEWNPPRPLKLKSEPCGKGKWTDCMYCSCVELFSVAFEWGRGNSDDWVRNSQRSCGKFTDVNSELSSTSIAWGWCWWWEASAAMTVAVDSEDVDGATLSPNAPKQERRPNHGGFVVQHNNYYNTVETGC